MIKEDVLAVLKNGNKEEKEKVIKALSYSKIKELYNEDKNIFNYIFGEDSPVVYNAFKKLSSKEILDFYDYFKNEIELYSDTFFIEYLEHVSYMYGERCLIEKGQELSWSIVSDESIKFLENILVKYEDRLSNVENESSVLHFLINMIDRGINDEIMDKFMLNNKKNIERAISKCNNSRLFDLFEGLDSNCQIKILDNFYDCIYSHPGFKSLCDCLHEDVLVHLYNKDNTVTSKISVRHFLRDKLNDDTKKILDNYVIDDLSDVFSPYNWGHIENVRYVEKYFKDKIVCDGTFEKIDENTKLFSKAYIKNLKEMKVLMEEKKITRNSEIYKFHFKVFYNHLVASIHVDGMDEVKVKEMEKLFFRMVKNDEFWMLKKINSINMIALINRIGVMDIWANGFSLEQLLNYNVKDYRKLCDLMNKNNDLKEGDYEPYVLKLMLLVGYKRAEYILSIDNDVETLHHLVGHVNVKNIRVDKNGNPAVDNKFISLLFKDKDHNRVRKMLENKDSDLYKFFPRIINEWELIKMSNKNKSLKEVIEFLKNESVEVPIKYYRLDNSFSLIGRSNDLVLEAFNLHDEMLKRVESTIPRVKGKVNDYEYEVLRYDDMEGLVVGNKTDCCFTVRGVSSSSLRHALTSKNGRVLTVKKNGELLAHSWLWRNGNTLCLDNIEISKKISAVDFIEVYEDFANEVYNESLKNEGSLKGIANIVVGGDPLARKYLGFNKYPCCVKKNNVENSSGRIFVNELPKPIEEGLYSDAKYSQWLIKGKGDFSFYQSKHFYKDERKPVLIFDSSGKDDWDFIKLINKMVNGLRIIKEGNDNYNKIDVRGFSKVYCSGDYYVIVDNKGNIESFVYSKDDRADEEVKEIINFLNKNKSR